MKRIIFVLFVVMTMNTQAQVAINTTNTTPNAYAMLDVSGTEKGVLIP